MDIGFAAVEFMKCAVFYGKHDIRIEERPIPTPKPNEVLIKVMACGVCGTDVHIFEGDKGAADCIPPKILGHEFSGVIEKVGADVRNINIGERVCVDPNVLCGGCYYCLSGKGHFCTHMIGIGTTVDGGFAEYCCVPAQQVHKLADGVTFEAGAMAEPVACCIHGADMSDITSGASVLVIGGGMIGLIMLQLARLAGAAVVAVSEPSEAKRIRAAELGADVCIDPLAEDPVKSLQKHGISRLDTVIECAGLPRTIEQAIEVAGNKSTVMMFGLTKPDDTISLKPFTVFQKEITLRASFINPYTQSRAVSLINSGKIDVTSMVSGILPLEKLGDVLSDAGMRMQGKFIIRP